MVSAKHVSVGAIPLAKPHLPTLAGQRACIQHQEGLLDIELGNADKNGISGCLVRALVLAAQVFFHPVYTLPLCASLLHVYGPSWYISSKCISHPYVWLIRV